MALTPDQMSLFIEKYQAVQGKQADLATLDSTYQAQRRNIEAEIDQLNADILLIGKDNA